MIAPELRASVEAAHLAKRLCRQEARRARDAVAQAIRDGVLLRPSSCTRCPNAGPVQAHHFMGYEERHWLAVLWLCRDCHVFAERAARIIDGAAA